MTSIKFKLEKQTLVFGIISILYLSACNTEKTTHHKLSLQSVLHEYTYCKSNSTKKSDCKWFTSKAICGYFQIDDFVDEEYDGAYLPYDKVVEYVEQSIKWKLLGEASNQRVLDEAVANTERGIPTIAISKQGGSGNAAIILPGKGTKSTSWGVTCPKVAVFMPHSYQKSFIDKTLNYAWASPTEVFIYSKK